MKPIIITSIALTIAALALVTAPLSYADNPQNVTPPPQCAPYHPNPTATQPHGLTVLNAHIMPGDTVTVQASFVGNSLVKQVRFLWYDGSNTLVQNHAVPRPMPSINWVVQDTFVGVAGPNTTWTVIACFEGPGHTDSINTYHINVASFFVFPESPIGAAALVGSSLAALGAFAVLKPLRAKN